MTAEKKKQLSDLMLLANLLSGIFYSASYPYIYAETIKVVTRGYLSFEQIFYCLGAVLFGILWNKYGNNLFKHYRKLLIGEILADTFLFIYVIITGNLSFFFILNVIIAATVTKNLCCGGIKMRAKVNPTEQLRERYDNNSNIINSISTLTGATAAAIFNFNINTLFILALIGCIVDNFFYLYIYNKIQKDGGEV